MQFGRILGVERSHCNTSSAHTHTNTRRYTHARTHTHTFAHTCFLTATVSAQADWCGAAGSLLRGEAKARHGWLCTGRARKVV
eukprot:1156044-Pelagomonas_calceolata.AAC.6